MSDHILQHLGIFGMKRGERQTPKQIGHRTQSNAARVKGTKSYAEVNVTRVEGYKKNDKSISADQKKKDSMKMDVEETRTLSFADIRKKMEQVKMEKQLKELTAEEITPGKKFVQDVLSSSEKQVMDYMTLKSKN